MTEVYALESVMLIKWFSTALLIKYQLNNWSIKTNSAHVTLVSPSDINVCLFHTLIDRVTIIRRSFTSQLQTLQQTFLL